MIIKPIGLVELMGGLGNQIFQICFADFLRSQGIKVYLSNSWFSQSNQDKTITQRSLELDPDKFGLDSASSNLLKSFKFLEFTTPNKLIGKSIVNTYTDKDLQLSNLARFNIFYGYWHNLKYFENKREFIISSLLKHDFYINNESQNVNKTLVHIRRTDYSIANEVLPDKYYLKAFSKLKKLGEDTEYDIFFDEETYDEKNSLFKNAQNVYINNGESPLTTLSKMINYKNFVIANSSFSLMAAFLNNNAVNVFYPSPWFQNAKYIPPVLSHWKSVSY